MFTKEQIASINEVVNKILDGDEEAKKQALATLEQAKKDELDKIENPPAADAMEKAEDELRAAR